MSKAEKTMIPLSVPVIRGNEWKYVKECLDTGWVSSVGGFVDRFEKSVADFVGVPYAVAVVNGTAALHLSLLVGGVKSGDEVIVPVLTFIAPVNAVKYCQAHPVFVDCNSKTLGMDVSKLKEFLAVECVRQKDGTFNKKTKRRIAAIIPVHIFGHPVDMDSLMALAREYSILVVEDATESIGSEYKKRKTGGLADIGCFSFNGNKIITTGGGGMIVTANRAYAEKMRHLSTQAKCDLIEYDHDAVAFNYRLTNVLAAIGVAQMESLPEYLRIKRVNAAVYREALKDIPQAEFLWEESWAMSNFWFYTVKVAAQDKNALLRHLLDQKIQARPIWKLMHTLPMYSGDQSYKIEKAQEIYDTCLNLPCSVDLTEKDLKTVTNCIQEFFQKKSVGAGK